MARNFILDPTHWRFRAEEARTVADQMTHEEARTIMRRIAMDYDRLANLLRHNLPIRKQLDEKLRTNCSFRPRIAAPTSHHRVVEIVCAPRQMGCELTA
jgi:hypothetical protein